MGLWDQCTLGGVERRYKRLHKPSYTVDHGTMPPSCLPTKLESANLVDITRIGDSWRRYMDTQTGETHDGAVYAAEMQQAG